MLKWLDTMDQGDVQNITETRSLDRVTPNAEKACEIQNVKSGATEHQSKETQLCVSHAERT